MDDKNRQKENNGAVRDEREERRQRRMNRFLESWLVPILLAIALIAVSVWGASESARAENYKAGTETMYSRAFGELANDFNDMDMTLGKLNAVSSPAQYVLLLDDLWRLSGSAVSLMSQVPSSHVDTADMNRFVVQLGDYSHSLTMKALRGSPIVGEDTEQLSALRAKCSEIASELNSRIEAGDIPIEVITNDGYYTSTEGSQEGTEDDASIDTFPTLIYDGPFSDSSEKAEPKGLSGGDVSEEDAMRTASDAAGVELTFAGRAEGNLSTYEFEGTHEDGREVYASVTVKGGKLLYMMSSAKSGAQGVPEESETARYRDAAVKYLSQSGYGDMTATYAQFYDGAALINCAAVQDGVILYSDLVKVWIDREDVSVIGVDARNYIYSHVDRQLPEPAITLEEAEGYVTGGMTIESRETALIPITPMTEKLCYEFKGRIGEESYIIYINALTGDEEQVFMIIDSENGQLVI